MKKIVFALLLACLVAVPGLSNAQTIANPSVGISVKLNKNFELHEEMYALVTDYLNLHIKYWGVETPVGCAVENDDDLTPCPQAKAILDVTLNGSTQQIYVAKGNEHTIFGAKIKVIELIETGTTSVTLYVTAATKPHDPGTNIKTSNGTVWFIDNNFMRRAYTSAGSFLSYGFNNWASVVPANDADLTLLPEGKFIPPADGRILCSDRGDDRGTCYLMTETQKAGFTSESVFKNLGFSFANALMGDVSFVASTAHINNGQEAHRPGVLVNYNGEINLVGKSCLMGIPSMEVFNSWGFSFQNVVPVNNADIILRDQSIRSGSWSSLSPRSPGTLVPRLECSVE